MIAVIADDITGGAEIAGIGLRYGLTVELSTRSDIPIPDVELWVISTDSRSMNRDEATRITANTVRNLKAAGIIDIFKKTDSVLRGHVVAELAAQLEEEGKKQIVLCPANPKSGRKIINGNYLIDGIPLHETGFSNDPDFPVNTSNVREILGSDFLKGPDITIVDAASKEDLQCAARLKDNETILAGSAAFFTAYIESLKLVPLPPGASIPDMKNALFVRGSTFNKSRDEVEKAAANGSKVIYLSPLIIGTADYKKRLKEYCSELSISLNRQGKAVLAIDRPVLHGDVAVKIKDMVAEVVSMVIPVAQINELVIEGGATSSAIFEKMNFTRFIPTYEFAEGVVRMKVNMLNKMYVTIKPGSYKFPEQVWNFENNE